MNNFTDKPTAGIKNRGRVAEGKRRRENKKYFLTNRRLSGISIIVKQPVNLLRIRFSRYLPGGAEGKMQEMFKMQAEIYKSFSSPSRLHIIKLLRDDELNATDIIKETGLSKANLSQHMSVLVQNGLVSTRKQGTSVFYRLSNKKIFNACSLIQEMAMDNIKKKNDMIHRAM